MALLSDNEVKLRITAQAEGKPETDALAESVGGLEKELSAAATAASAAASKQKETAATLASAKQAQDDLRLALLSAQNEYKHLRSRAKEAGSAQSLFAEQADRAKSKVADLKTSLAVASANVRMMSKENTAAASEVRRLVREQDALKKALVQSAGAAKQSENSMRDLGGSAKNVAAAMAAVFSVGAAKNAIGSAISTADAYGQMASRIKMATSSSEEYDAVQARLLETANATYRPLAEAQEVYIRTSDALRSLGYNTDQALDVVDSLSFLLVTNAASAEKGKNAIDAYSKSIQKGKIDADAWQSIMAATPTIVDAIAEASGKTAKEVRALGAAGKLAVKDLNEGLRQSVEVNKDLAASMPTTVADAVTALSNAWQNYLGNANQATGATQHIVAAINVLATNLDTVVSAAIKAGEVMLAVFSVRALRAVKSYAAAQIAAAQAAATLTTASAAQATTMAATTRATTAMSTSTALLAAAYRTVGAPMAAFAASATAGTTALLAKIRAIGLLKTAIASTGVGLLVVAFGELVSRLQSARSETEKTAEALELIKAADISTPKGIETLLNDLKRLESAGEITGNKIAIALTGKLESMGKGELGDLQKMLAEPILAATVPAAQLEMLLGAIGTRLAEIGRMEEINEFADKYFDKTKPALESVQEALDTLRKRGPETAEALAKIFKTADLSGVDAIKTLARDLDLLKSAALATGEQIDAALMQRLAQMSGKELREFRVMSEMALQGTAQDAAMLARINDQVLAASFARLGVSASTALDDVGAETADAIESINAMIAALDAAGKTAQQQGAAIEMALTQAFGSATSLAGINALQEQVGKLAASGKIGEESMQRLGQAAEDARRQIEAQIPGLQSVEEAFKALGVVSDAALKQSATAARDAFRQIAESGKASAREIQSAFAAYAEKAVAANGGVVDSGLRSEAAMRGLQVRADEAGKVTVQSFLEAREETKRLEEQASKTAGSMGKIGDAAADSAGKVIDAAANAADASRSVSTSITTEFHSAVESLKDTSKYANEAAESVWKAANAGKALWEAYDWEGMGKAVKDYASQMERLDEQQKSLSSSGAAGVEELRLKLLELSGSEEQIARARAARDIAELERKKALLQIELHRAQLRNDATETAYYQTELVYLAEQIKLTDQLARATEKKRQEEAKKKAAESAAKATTEQKASPTRLNQNAVTINVNGVTDPVKLARLVEPELKKLERLAK